MVLKLLRRLSGFLARAPGLPILVAVGLILLNLIFQVLPGGAVVRWLSETNLCLHLGLMLGFLGILLGDAL